MYIETRGLDNSTVRAYMDPMVINLMFGIVVSLSFAVWLVACYWHVKLFKRILFVSQDQHPIPGNVSWIKRARMAIKTDKTCQDLVHKRNIWGIAFLCTIAVLGCVMAYVVLTVDVA